MEVTYQTGTDGRHKRPRMRVMILGGYGVFGGRLIELLSDLQELELVVCGRSLERAREFCALYRGAARLEPLALDRLNISEALRTKAADLVVDASEPFQDYGS